MKTIISLLLFICVYNFLQAQPVFSKKYKGNGSELFSIETSGKKNYALKHMENILENSLSVADASKFRSKVMSAIQKELFRRYPNENSAVIGFSKNFAIEAARVITNPIELNKELAILELSDEYSVSMILTAPGSYLYFFNDKSVEGTPTDLFDKSGGSYAFRAADIKSSMLKEKILFHFFSILQFIRKNKEVELPTVHLSDDGTQQEIIFDPDGTPVKIALPKIIFEELKGDQKAVAGSITTYEIKNGSVTKMTEENKKNKDAERSKDEIIGTYMLIVDGQNYSLQLIKKESGYFLSATGAEVTITKDAQDANVKNTGASITKTSSGSLPTLTDSEASFKLMADNVMKAINSATVTSDVNYIIDISKMYNYFRGLAEAAIVKEKRDGFNEKIIGDSKLVKIAAEEETKVKVGSIRLQKMPVKVYSDDVPVGTATIDSVTLSLYGGKLARRLLLVETTDRGTFFNEDAPIPLHKINMSKRKYDRLYNLDGSGTYIRLGELLRFAHGNGYFADDVDNIVLKPNTGENQADLSAAVNLNSIVNFSIYTDLAGLLGRRANGLLISDVSGRFITNAGNIFNRDVTLLSFVDANVTVSKFDSKFRSLDSSGIHAGAGGQMDTVDRMKLMQTAWLKGSMKVNILSTKTYTQQYLNVNFGARINVVNGDSLFKKEADIIMFEYYPELSYSVNRLKNFGMESSLKWIFQRVADKELFANKGWQTIFNPQVAFYYYPFKNPSSTIYMRFNYFANKDREANNFYQLQFGWRSGLQLSKK